MYVEFSTMAISPTHDNKKLKNRKLKYPISNIRTDLMVHRRKHMDTHNYRIVMSISGFPTMLMV